MALIGEMQYLTIGGNTYSIPTSGGSTVGITRSLTSGTKSATITVDGTPYELFAPTPNAGTVTSVRVQATSPVQSSVSTAQTGTLNTTISLANGYGDTKNPYGTKTKNYVLAGPTTGNDAAPTFRALVAADIPDLSSTYLTSYTETDPVYSASAASGITSNDISNWNSKTSNTGTITSVKTTAGAHTTINVSSGAVNFNVPTATSHLTNDSGFLTSYTETDPIFSASAAAGITTADISNWNAKISDDKTWNGVELNKTGTIQNSTSYIPARDSTSATIAYQLIATTEPYSYRVAKWDDNAYLYSTTPSANDNSTKVATTAYVDAITIPTKTSDLTNDSGFITSSAIPALLSGSTTTITPTQVINALANNQNVEISYTDATYGTSKVYDFTYNVALNMITAPLIFRWNGEWLLFELIGRGSDNIWYVVNTTLAQLSDISTIENKIPIITDNNTNYTFNLERELNAFSYGVDGFNISYNNQGFFVADGSIIDIIPTATSDLTNDSGFITSYTETDPIFSASVAAGITATDVSNWNAKPTKTSDLTNDSNFAQVQIIRW